MRPIASRVLPYAPLVTLVTALVGCSHSGLSGQGVVKFVDGQPVMSGGVEFRSLADGARYASRIQPDGSFDLQNNAEVHGIPAGDYEVVVVQLVLTEHLAASEHTHGNTVPRRYADYYTSGLKVSLAADHVPPIKLVLENK